MCESDTSKVTASSWIKAINRASHPYHTLQKFDVLVKVGSVFGMERKGSLYEQATYREPWILSHLSTLTVGKSNPHFPRIFGTSRCVNLPKFWDLTPGAESGIVPSAVHGYQVIDNIKMQKQEGGLLRVQYGAMITEHFGIDMGELIRSYKGLAVSNEFVKGIAFQLIHTLGVARDAFGLYHNDLLSLSASLRMHQVMQPSPQAKEAWCYQLGKKEESTFIIHKDPCFVEKNYVEEVQGNGTSSQFQSITWCMSPDDVDGLQLKLYNFASATLKKTSLEWWQRGFTFQNLPWGDDMKDVAIIICDLLGSKVAHLDALAIDLCTKAKNGDYYSNPLEALYHPYFDDYVTKNVSLFLAVSGF
jgi:hypothetical protein